MGTSTTFHIGCYLVCTMSSQPVDVENHECSHNNGHQVEIFQKFCPECGSAVRLQIQQQQVFQSLNDFFCGTASATEPDIIFLRQEFSPMQDDWISFDQVGKEIITYDHSQEVFDSDSAGVIEMRRLGAVLAFSSPTKDKIAHLKSIVGYTNVEVKFGVLIASG